MTWARTLAITVFLAAGARAPAFAGDCKRADFEAVVASVATALGELHAANKPVFQGRLAQLKAKRGWSQDEFLRQAAPLVQDETIATLDARASEMLDRIQSGGDIGTTAREPDCALLEELRGTLKMLVGVQTEKWNYMLKRVEEELAR